MIRLVYIVLIILITGCVTKSGDKKVSEGGSAKMTSKQKLENTIPADSVVMEDTSKYDFATYYVIIADTSTNYYILDKEMLALNRKLKIPIDTMGRFYNKKKNLIALPDNDQDEIYAGDYFPRRFPSENLSLEYLAIYQNRAGEQTIALVTGIYESEKKADSALVALRKTEKKIFKIKTEMYVGCLH